jgi:Di-haem oxidoreductase, putative peroxidase
VEARHVLTLDSRALARVGCAVAIVLFGSMGLPAAVSADDLAGERPALGPRVHQADLANMSVAEMIEQGRRIFTTPFNVLDGLGDGPMDPRDPTAFGSRPTADNNGMFLRINGLDSQTCNECHSIVSNAERPPLLGVGGVGGVSTNAFFRVTNVDVADTRNNGFAEIDGGRFINPPFLFGSGGVEAVGKEMTADLQALKQVARENPGTAVPLVTKGVSFGELSFDGFGFDYSRVEGIDTDLVVKPFGRKGEFPTVRSFDVDALQFHLGMQAVERVGEGVDADGDGVVNEILPGELSVLDVHNVMLPRPRQTLSTATARSGRRVFFSLGCADCHVPELRTEQVLLPLAYPEVPTDPSQNVYLELDLAKGPPGFQRYGGGGVRVPLFSDLKRYDMGPGLAESAGFPLDDVFITARLWGVADSAPYLHDGRATTLSEAIAFHGGEAQPARDRFEALRDEDRVALLEFLRTLKTPRAAAQ